MNVNQIFPFLIVLVQDAIGASPLDILYTFNVPKFVEGSTEEYIGKNVIIFDVDYWKDPTSEVEKYFITTPRGRPGTPATLSRITTGANNETLLAPYPSWTDNLPNCDSIVSAFRTQIDSCNRLWVIDAGTVDAFTDGSTRICQPKIWLFDLKTDTLINQYEMPDDVLNPDTLVTTITVDIRNNKCDEAFAYIADIVGYNLMVFSLVERRFWYFRNRMVYPYPLDGNFKINGVTFDLMDGIIGLALGPVIGGDRTLYFHSLASRRESMVQTSILQNSQLGGESSAELQGFKVSVATRSSQSATEAVWDNALYFNMVGDNVLACWPLPLSCSKEKPIRLYKNATVIQFVAGVKAIDGNLFLLSNTFQNYFGGNTDVNEINYRIIRTSINKLTRGRGCRRR